MTIDLLSLPPRGEVPCPNCGRTVVFDRDKDSIGHAEPVCASFERFMAEHSGDPPRAGVRTATGEVATLEDLANRRARRARGRP